MDAAVIARPYAAAAFAYAREEGDVDGWNAALQNFAQAAETLNALVAKRRFIGEADKADIILEAAGGNPAQKRFIDAMAENNRLRALPAVAARFDALRMDAAGIVRARVESAMPVEDKKAREAFDAFLEKRFASRVESTYAHDAGLIGGARVYVRDDVLDASIKGRLERLAAALSARA